MAAGEMDIDRPVERRRAPRTIARSPRRGAWCRRRRTCSRHCRCRRQGRRGSRWPAWQGRARRLSPRRRRPCRRRRRRSAGSARPSGGYRRRRNRAPHPARPRICAALMRCRPAAPRRSSSVRPASAGARRYARSGRCGGRGAIASAGTFVSLRPSFSSTWAMNFSRPHASSTYFSRALVRSVRSPWSMIDAHDGVGDLRRVLRLDDHAGVACKILDGR